MDQSKRNGMKTSTSTYTHTHTQIYSNQKQRLKQFFHAHECTFKLMQYSGLVIFAIKWHTL